MPDIRTRFQNDILWLILDRPPLNVLSSTMLDELTAAMDHALQLGPRLVVLIGAGEEAFSAGIEVGDHQQAHSAEILRAVADNCAAFARLRSHGIATVALVKGLALGGGCELAVLCDTVLAHEKAIFGLPEIDQGIFSPVAATYFPSRLGYQTTMRLMLTGETISANEALRLGLAHQVLSEHRFLTDAEELLVLLTSLA